MKWKVLAALAAAFLAITLLYNKGLRDGRLEGQLDLTRLEKDLADARADAQDAQQTKQRALAAQHEKLDHEHAQAMVQMQLDAATDRAESDRLRGQLAGLQDRLQRASSIPSATGFKLPPGTRAAMVLSDLLSSCSAERSELAAAFDGARTRGLAVEARYDTARGQ